MTTNSEYYPPPTSPNFKDALQGEENREGCTESLHQVYLCCSVSPELKKNLVGLWCGVLISYRLIVDMDVLRAVNRCLFRLKYCFFLLSNSTPYCHVTIAQGASLASHPKSIGEYFHCTFQREKPGEGGVHVVEHKFICFSLMVVLMRRIHVNC